MKKNKNRFSFYRTIRKYKAWAIISRGISAMRNIPGTEAFYYGSCHHEKLQIIYANIRV